MSASLREFIPKLRAGSRAFGYWWLSELTAMIPENIRQKLVPSPEATVISFEGHNAIVRHFDGHGFAEIRRESLDGIDRYRRDQSKAAFSPAQQVAIVALPGESAFVGRFKVPISARSKLRQAIAFEVERRSPFRSEDALFDFSILKSENNQTLNVEWATIPSDLVQKGRAVARSLGYEASAIGIADDDQKNLKYVFDKRKATLSIEFRKSLNCLLLSLALFVGMALYVLVEQSVQTGDVERELAALKTQALQAQTTKATVEKMAAAVTAVTTRSREPSALEILREVTSVLSDDTWVIEFDLKGRELHLIGYSMAASGLIERFSDSSLFEHAHFNAPVTFQDSKKGERFDIVATVRDRPEAEKSK